MKIKALKYKQLDKDIFIFSADPNYIKKLVKISDISVNDKNFQRPYDEKRVAQIKNYVLGKDKLYKKGKDIFAKGYIPNAIVLNLSSNYKVKKTQEGVCIDFPDRKEIKNYKESIEVIDGQHRLLAFDDECKKKLEKQGYKMCFVALINLTNDEKKEIFMVLNERQKTVDKNILLRQKKLLNLLLDEEETRYEVISRLSEEKDSPFFEKIIIAGEKIKYGLKTTQIDEVFKSSQILDDLTDSKSQIDSQYYQVLKNYFTAWQINFKKIWFISNSTITKIAGVRFICYLFPFIYDILKKDNNFKVKFFSSIIKEIKNNYFNEEFDLKQTEYFQNFQERTGIIKLAKKIGKELSEHHKIKDKDIIV